MAFDFLAVPAMSSEYERVFSSYAKETTPKSSRLTRRMLWHQECLKNWHRRGVIKISEAFNAVVLEYNSDSSE
jgi:hAT family C-terminal dimerisation region